MYVVLRLKSLGTTGALAPFALVRVRATGSETSASPDEPPAPPPQSY
jgi:hypothetical protein